MVIGRRISLGLARIVECGRIIDTLDTTEWDGDFSVFELAFPSEDRR
jgi:hypothetical protein